MQIKIETPVGVVCWAPGGSLQGGVKALNKLRSPLPGRFGLMPDQVPFDQALARKDSFLHLVATIWPTYQIVTDTVTDEEWSPYVVY